MFSKSTVISALLLSIAMPQISNAQALKGVRAPANLPPADYTGAQYVDNNGCIFVRAGRLGTVSWVPRLDQSRKHMCSKSYTATFSTPTVVASSEKPTAAKPTAAGDLDRGNVAYKGDVIKPVEAPDTSLVQAKEAKPVFTKPQVSDAAKAAKAAAAKAAKDEERAKVAAQNKVAEKMKADAIAKRKASEKLKAAQIAKAEKEAVSKEAEESQLKAKIAEKIAQDKKDRLAARAAAKAARTAALAEKKAARAAAKKAAAAARAAKLAKPEVEAKPVAEAKPTVTKTVNTAKADRAAAIAAKRAAAKEAKEARAAEMAAKKQAAKKAKSASKSNAASAFKSGFYVDLGTAMNEAKANQVAKRLKSSGYRVVSQIAGNSSRVYAGPFRTASNAKVAIYQVVNEGFKRASIIKK